MASGKQRKKNAKGTEGSKKKKARNVKGSDHAVVIGGLEMNPNLVEMKEKWDLEYVRNSFPGASQVWFANKNLCHSLNGSVGGVIYVASLAVVALVVRMHGFCCFVKQLYPVTLEPKYHLIDSRVTAWCLEQVLGRRPLDLYRGKVNINIDQLKRSIDGETKEIIPALDEHGHLKMSSHGPDVLKMPKGINIPEDIRAALHNQQLETPAPGSEGQQTPKRVTVWYVYLKKKNWNIKHARKDANGIPLFNVPIGIPLQPANESVSYVKQKFAHVPIDEIRKILKEKEWTNQDEFEKKMAGFDTSEYCVPSIPKDGLRIKHINQNEYSQLLQKKKRGQAELEEIAHNGLRYLIGEEPIDLTDKKFYGGRSYGRQISFWKVDQRATSLLGTYEFVKAAIAVFGDGYGSREVAPCFGLNAYTDPHGRQSARPHPTPAVADEDIPFHNYHNASMQSPIIGQFFHRTLNLLTDAVVKFAQKSNPELMEMVGPVCTKSIVTTGGIPWSRGRRRCTADEAAIVKKQVLAPPYGFVNGMHVDSRDKLDELQLDEWKNVADKKKWSFCKSLMEELDDFCLPTTCGYQFLYNSKEFKENVEPVAYFSLDGLGLAVELCHGIAHHFHGAVFTHCTCLPICRKGGMVSSSNSNDSFLIFAWGRSGGSRQVTAARRATDSRAAATTADSGAAAVLAAASQAAEAAANGAGVGE